MEYGYLDKEVKALVSERDRLAAENAKLRADLVVVGGSFSHSNATLARLREVVPEVLPPHMSWRDALDGARAILYPKETDNGD